MVENPKKKLIIQRNEIDSRALHGPEEKKKGDMAISRKPR